MWEGPDVLLAEVRQPVGIRIFIGVRNPIGIGIVGARIRAGPVFVFVAKPIAVIVAAATPSEVAEVASFPGIAHIVVVAVKAFDKGGLRSHDPVGRSVGPGCAVGFELILHTVNPGIQVVEPSIDAVGITTEVLNRHTRIIETVVSNQVGRVSHHNTTVSLRDVLLEHIVRPNSDLIHETFSQTVVIVVLTGTGNVHHAHTGQRLLLVRHTHRHQLPVDVQLQGILTQAAIPVVLPYTGDVVPRV